MKNKIAAKVLGMAPDDEDDEDYSEEEESTSSEDLQMELKAMFKAMKDGEWEQAETAFRSAMELC